MKNLMNCDITYSELTDILHGRKVIPIPDDAVVVDSGSCDAGGKFVRLTLETKNAQPTPEDRYPRAERFVVEDPGPGEEVRFRVKTKDKVQVFVIDLTKLRRGDVELRMEDADG